MLSIRNRYLFAPIKTGYSDGSGQVTDRHLVFYRERSQHAGAVISEPFYLDARLRELPTQMGIDADDKLDGLSRLVETFHDAGAAAVAHLNHPGRMANPKIPGNVFLSSTDRPCENGGATPRRMDGTEMDRVVDQFASAARRARRAGFDALELQLGHGYLLAQFLSSFVNDRSDGFGGDFEARVRFPLRVVDAVREVVDLPLLVRVSGSEMVDGGITVDETVQLARKLRERRVEAVHVSAGTVCSTPPWFFQHMFVPKGKTWDMAEQISRRGSVRVVAVGQIADVEEARSLQKRFADGYLAVGRALVADPDFVGKCLGTVDGPVRPCLACAAGCLGGVRSGRGLRCLVNPRVGREHLVDEPTDKSLRIAVAGAGPAGLQAAATLQSRGHHVDLYEKNEVGGQFNLAPLTPKKRSMRKLIPYLREAAERAGVRFVAQEARAEDMKRYDAVVVATGAKHKVPHIPGLDHYRWADILADDPLPSDQHVLILGGGLIGVDVATALIPRGNRVTIVKRTTDFGEDMEMIARNLSLKMLRESGTTFLDHTNIGRIDGRTAHGQRNGEPITIEDVDLVIVSTGMESVDELARELAGKLPVWTVGDARKVANAKDAIEGAYLTAREL